MKKHFKTEEDYLAFMELLDKQISDITFDGKRQIECSIAIAKSPVIKISKKEVYTLSLNKTNNCTLSEA